MHSFTKKKKVIFLCVLLCFSLVIPSTIVFAEPPSLTIQLEEATNQLADVEGQIESLDLEIEEITSLLAEATANQFQQYQNMKARIKWLYENGGISIFETLLRAQNIVEFINYIEFVRAIHEYDQDMLLELTDITLDVETYSNELIEKQAELRVLREETLYTIEDLEEQIVSQTRLHYVPSEEEVYYFAQLLEAEAFTNYDYKLAVATVVLNRVFDPRFPDTITGVINQRMQFGPVVTGLIHRMVPGPEAMAAARDSIAGERHPAVTHAYFFNMVSGPHQPGVNIGGNVFW